MNEVPLYERSSGENKMKNTKTHIASIVSERYGEVDLYPEMDKITMYNILQEVLETLYKPKDDSGLSKGNVSATLEPSIGVWGENQKTIGTHQIATVKEVVKIKKDLAAAVKRIRDLEFDNKSLSQEVDHNNKYYRECVVALYNKLGMLMPVKKY